MTYPWATHAVLEEKPHCAGRLSPIRPPRRLRTYEPIGQRRDRPRIQRPPGVQENRGEDDRIIRERRDAQRQPIYGADMSPGYAGHVPRRRESFGRTPEPTYRRSLSDFERGQIAAGHGMVACSSFCHEHVIEPIQPRVRPPRTPQVQENREEDDRIIGERRSAQRQPVYAADMCPGYRGHVPTQRESIGRTPQHMYRRVLSDFEREQRAQRGSVGVCSSTCHAPVEERRERVRPSRPPAVQENKEEDERIIRERRSAQKHPLLGVDVTCGYAVSAQTKYYGKKIGDIRTQAHDVKGTVYIVDDRTIFVENFHYDGQGPDAFFWGDSNDVPTPNGFIIDVWNGTEGVLGAYRGQNLILTLPAGKSIKDMRSLGVWCRKFTVNFGSVVIPTDDIPSQKSLGPLPSLAHGVKSDDVIILDSKTLLIKNLYYDGAGPDAFFLAGTGVKPHSKGIKIPDEDGRLEKLRGYTGKDVLLRLPGDLTVFDIDWMGLYCIRFEQNFGHVMLPERPNIPANLEDLTIAASSSVQSRQANRSMISKLKDHQYYGKPIAEFKTNAHDVSGTVFAATDDTFYIVDFNYDGQGPDAYFWAGTTEKPSPEGFIVPDEFGTKEVLGKYTGRNIAITLPDGKKISDIKWLSVWCRKFTVNFGHIKIPDDFKVPKEKNLGPLSSLAHGVRSGSVIIKNSKTIHISELYYDGAGPDAFFLVGTGEQPHPEGIKVPDENGSLQKLHGYQGESIELRLPNDLTVFDIDWFALYCIQFTENFGNVMLKVDLDIPADLKLLRNGANKDIKYDNCEELFPGVMQVSWKIVGDDIFMQMAGKVEQNEYLSFGRSGSDDRAAMVGSDVAVAFYDSESRTAKVIDYYLSAKSQCSGGSGACPDEKFRGKDNTELISWERSDGILRVNFKRPLSSSDDQDMSIPVALPVSVVAAIGPLNSQKEVAFHTHHYNKEAKMIHFGRVPAQDRCTPFQFSATTSKPKSWVPQKISGITKFVAQIGPAGGDKGYTAITGIQSWGIAWWINGLLIPEITVQRGTNYTFIVEGGNNPSNSAVYHPLYITNNPEGGGGHYLDHIGLPNHTVYAGINIDSSQNIMPIGTGRYCEWKHQSVDKSEESATFEEYKKSLKLECEDGRPGSFTWMPDENTPDLVYYQCFTHRNLGWKIHVVDADVTVAGAMGQLLEENVPSSSKVIFANFLILLILLVSKILLT